MDPVLLRLLVVLGTVVVVAVVGRAWQRRDGAVRRTTEASQRPRVAGHHLDAVGLDLREAEAGAVLLGSPTCTPCEAVKRVLGRLAEERPGFRWVYADAADHLDLAQAHRVLRVPTLLLVGPDARLLARTSGVPSLADLHEALDGSVAADAADASAA